MIRMLIFALLAVALVAAPTFAQPKPCLHDWSLSGVVVNTQLIPNSGGAWAITIGRERPGVGGTDFLLFICDHEQPVTAICAGLGILDVVDATGYVLSNEPQTGQRLSVRTLEVTLRGDFLLDARDKSEARYSWSHRPGAPDSSASRRAESY